MTDELSRAVGALQDRQDVIDVVATFCDRVDEYDIDALRAVFTEDCFTDYGPGRGGPVRGLEAVIARIKKGQSEFRRTQHQLGQSLVHLIGDAASANTYVTATHEDWSGAISRVHLRYLDSLVRTPAGWRISERRVQACVVDGMPGVSWAWVERLEPVQ